MAKLIIMTMAQQVFVRYRSERFETAEHHQLLQNSFINYFWLFAQSAPSGVRLHLK